MNQKKVMRLKEKFPVKGLRHHMLKNIEILEKDPNLEDLEYQDSIIAVRCGKEDHAHTSILFPPNEENRNDILEKIYLEAGRTDLTVSPYSEETEQVELPLPKRIVFHNRQAIGDIIMFTCAVRDFKKQFPNIEIQVQSTVPHMWDYNPNLNREKWSDIVDPLTFKTKDGKPSDGEMLECNKKAIQKAIEEDKAVKLYIGPGKATNASNRSDNHFANAFRISIETILGISIKQGPIRGDLYMTEEEYNRPPIIEPPYWLITAGEKGDWTAKTFAFVKWQEVVEKLSQIKFVQIGSRGHKHPKLSGDNVINFIGKTEDRNTGFRDLLNLFNYCEGSAGLVSFQMHLSAVFNKPCVVVAGAREPVWFTRYPGQQYLATDGCLPCTVAGRDIPTACWKCDVNGCLHLSEYKGHKVPLCEDLISSDEVVEAILKYYKGGRLSFEKPLGRSKLINVVKTPLKIVTSEPKEIDTLWGFTWGGSSITDQDWDYIKHILKEENIKSVCEFGSGLSTLLFDSVGMKVVSYETRKEDIQNLKKINSDLDIRYWDGKEVFIPEEADLVFIDGPGGGSNRESSFIMSKSFKRILVHDAGRSTEIEWQTKHLLNDFMKVSQGGHRTAFWRHKSIEDKVNFEEDRCHCQVESAPKVKVVFNGRGEGGAESSTTWIMNEFIRRGWKVDYISPNSNPSGTFRLKGNPKIKFINHLSKINEECDLLFLYTNDWVWEFPRLVEIFSDLKAKRKVMAVNFRLGQIGKVEWTRGWDKYLFLNSSLEKAFIENVPEAVTKVLAPPVDLSDYYKNEIDYSGNLRIVRHSSQGDTKYPKDLNEKLTDLLWKISLDYIRLMPAPTFIDKEFVEIGAVVPHKRNNPKVSDFLKLGNVFWYCLPEGYHDQGPKVIMEAQASGLPVVADNHSGAKDRVVEGTGFLCNSFSEHLDALTELQDESLREEMGKKARDHAKKEYGMEKWIEGILS